MPEETTNNTAKHGLHEVGDYSNPDLAELAQGIRALEEKEAIAHSRIDSELLIDKGVKLARKAAFKHGDVALTIRAARIIEAQYRSKWGTSLGESLIRARKALHDIKPWIMDARTELLDEFSERPADTAIWGTAYEWVRAEADMPAYWTKGTEKRRPTIADDIPGEELIDLAKRVKEVKPEDRYGLMTHKASNGQSWFDVLKTFSSPQIEAAEEKVIQRELGNSLAEVALDLGTGTGKSLPKLHKYAEKVLGLDRNEALLNEANTALDQETQLVRGDVKALPVRDGSVDIVSSSGLVGALDRGTSEAFFKEIARSLKPGGFYIDGSYHFDEGYGGEELGRIVATSKAMLADMIVDTVSGKFELKNHLSFEERQKLLGKVGLGEDTLIVEAEPGSITKSQVTLITKKR